MIKLAKMQEKLKPIGAFPLNQNAKEIGLALSQASDINGLTNHKFYELERIGQARAGAKIPLSYQHKKHVFSATIPEQEVIVIHFSGEDYCQDLDYFKRAYENSRDFYGGQLFPDRKIGPSLLGYDDKMMTLIVEKASRDLSVYFSSTDKDEVERVIDASVDLMIGVWEKSKEDNDQTPRYIKGFLEPEYFFLKGKRVEDYLKDPQLIDEYKQVQKELSEYLSQLGDFKRGFGFPDVKPSNLVEDEEGNLLFIDVAKPDNAYHWLTQLGQFYQGTVKEAPNSLLSKELKKRATQLIESHPQPDLALKLFALGRINRLLIVSTLRNIVYTKEIGLVPDEEIVRSSLSKVKPLIKAQSIKEVTQTFS